MKPLPILLLAAVSVTATHAQKRAPVTLEGVDVTRNIAYAGTENPRQMLDLYLPETRKTEVLPVVVFIHGGAWRGGHKNSGSRWLKRYVESGEYAGVSIGYRLTGEATWPAQIHDCKSAIRWIRGNAKKHGLDPDKIGIAGTSAGGHLVAMLGTSGGLKALEGELGDHNDQSSAVTCVANFFGPAELLTMGDHPSTMDHNAPNSPESKLVGGTLHETKEVARQASPITHVTKDDPPMLHIHGTDDKLVPFPQSVVFDKALREAGCESALLTIEGGGHGGFRNPAVEKRVVEFFAKHLLGRDAEIKSETLPAR